MPAADDVGVGGITEEGGSRGGRIEVLKVLDNTADGVVVEVVVAGREEDEEDVIDVDSLAHEPPVPSFIEEIASANGLFADTGFEAADEL